uniref:Uncharacterized protein n=1 Tax=Cacopsylla melanoneura TaxID=428564 RepID=A0A8D9BCN6_9HEMI
MNWRLSIMAWLYIGITSSMARKSSSRNHGSRNREPDVDMQDDQPFYDSNSSNEKFQHIKVPIIEADHDSNHQDNEEYPKVYEENNDVPPPPNSAEFQAPSSEFEAPEYKPPHSGEIFDEESYRDIVNSVTIPNVKYSGTEKDSDAPMDPDLHMEDDTPEIPPELVDIKIPTTIPKPNVKIKRKPKRRKKPSTPEPSPSPIKKTKKSRKKVKKTKNIARPDQEKEYKSPDQEKEYSQVVDNSNPKEEVLIIKPIKKKKQKPKTVFMDSDFQFPTQPRPRPKVRIPVTFYRNPTFKKKPKRINVVIQNRKKKPLLITHQNGDVIYWYPSKQATSRNPKYMCKRSRFGNQCVNLQQAPKRPVAHFQRVPKLSSYTFLKATKSTPNYFDDFDNGDKDSLLLYKVIKDPKKKKIPGGIVKFSQSLFEDDNEEMGSFFKEIDDQGEDGIDEPEAENHEDERITDEEVDNDKATTDNEEQEEEENKEPEQEENTNVYDEPPAQDYPE